MFFLECCFYLIIVNLLVEGKSILGHVACLTSPVLYAKRTTALTYLVGILLQSMIHVTVDSHVHLLFAVHDFIVYWTNTNNKWLVSFSNVNSLSIPASFPPHVIPAEYIHSGCKCQHIQSSPGQRGRLLKAMLLT